MSGNDGFYRSEGESAADFIFEHNSDSKLKILQLTDIQIIDLDAVRNPVRDGQIRAVYFGDRKFTPEEKCLDYAKKIITDEKPDLIVLTGDNVYGEFDDKGRMMKKLIDFMEGFRIPWAPVFGNHDNESAMGVSWQTEQYENAPHCIFSRGNVTGNSNYSVLVRHNGKPAELLVFFDSNGCMNLSPNCAPGEGLLESNPDYALMAQQERIFPDQIEWYKKTAQAVNEQAERKLPELFFMHFAPEIFRTAVNTNYGLTGTETTAEINRDGDWGYLDEAEFDTVDENNELYNAAKKNGLKGIFVGHWHNNAAKIVFDNTMLVFGLKAGWCSYEPKPRHIGGNTIESDFSDKLPEVRFIVSE